jgi:hypothetical protein
MKIEILSVPQCPSHAVAVKLVKDVLVAEGIVAKVRQVTVTDEGMAERLGFRGSPTIRVNGQDIFPESGAAEPAALVCRWRADSAPINAPAIEIVREAVRKAYAGERQ